MHSYHIKSTSPGDGQLKQNSAFYRHLKSVVDSITVLLECPNRNIKAGELRDRNAIVERQLAAIKQEILQRERNINPGKACLVLFIKTKGQAMEDNIN